jgi:hypothetical protein
MEDSTMPVTIAQLRATTSVDLMTAALALGLGRTKAYDLARRDQFPCRVIRIGETYRVPTAGLLELLGVTAEEPRSHTPAVSRA